MPLRLIVLLLLFCAGIAGGATAPGPLFLTNDGSIIPGGDARFPTPSQVGAMTGTSGTAPSATNKFVDNADQRLSGMFIPSNLVGPSQIDPTNKPTQRIQGASVPIVLTDPKWIMDGTFTGQRLSLIGAHPTFTVTGPTTATIKHCGGIGSVVIGSLHESPGYTWTGALWQRDGCLTIQQALNSGSKLLWGFTEASPFQIRGSDGSGGPSTNGFNIYENASGNPKISGICNGVPCANSTIGPLPIGGKMHVQNNAEVDIFVVNENGTVSGLSAGPAILAGNQSSDTTTCLSGGEIFYHFPVGRTVREQAAETAVTMRSPRAGTVKSLYVQFEAVVPTGQSAVFTVRKALAATALTTTVTAGNTQNANTSSTFSVALGDRLAVEIVCSGGTTLLPAYSFAFVIE